MKYFLDTEFHEDGRTIDLISIGIAAEDGREFYAVNRNCDFDRIWTGSNCEWLRQNVMPYLPHNPKFEGMSREEIKNAVLAFVAPEYSPTDADGDTLIENPQFWGYYADYDWVVFCQLFGRMIDLPNHFPKYCRDLKQVADVLDIRLPPPRADEHHALADAKWIRESYLFCVEHQRQQEEERKWSP